MSGTQKGLALKFAAPASPLSSGETRHIISGPAITPPRLLSASIIFSATKYHIPSAILSSAIQTTYFLRSRVLPARKHVNTYDVFSSRAAHRPFRLTTRTSRSSSYSLHLTREQRPSFLFLSLSLLPTSLRGAEIRAFTTSSFTRGFRKYFIPRAAFRFLSSLDVASSRSDATKGVRKFLRHFRTTWDDTERYNAVYARPQAHVFACFGSLSEVSTGATIRGTQVRVLNAFEFSQSVVGCYLLSARGTFITSTFSRLYSKGKEELEK